MATVSLLILINIFIYSCISLAQIRRKCKKRIKKDIKINTENSPIEDIITHITVKSKRKIKKSKKKSNLISIHNVTKVPKK